jgi:hypothetical protein
MKRFTEAGRLSIQQGNLLAALSLALMIPDICASQEDPGPGKTQKRYVKWCKEWVEPKFTKPARGPIPLQIFISAEDCFQLRCSLIHSGSAELEPRKQNILERFVFFDQSAGTHLNMFVSPIVKGVVQPSYLQLKADLFSEEMFKAADEWDAAMANDENVQAEKANLVLIHTKGDIINGVKFN